MNKDRKILVVLQRLGVSSGLTSFYMNYYLVMKKMEYNIDFLVCKEEESPYEGAIRQRGGKIHVMPKYKNNRDRTIYTYIYKLIKNENYDAIHVNIADFRAALIMSVAKLCNVPFRIYHSHNTVRAGESIKSRILSRIYDFICINASNKLLACTERAGKEIFYGREFTVIRNAIHVEDYLFSPTERERIRSSLNLKNEFLIGTVCRHAEQKNPLFIVDILSAYNKLFGETYLLWIGSGPLTAKIENYAYRKGIKNRLLLVGDKADVCKWYSAMDVFLMPSLYEGLGIVYIEAQTNGLHTFASDVVPRDSAVTDLIQYISLDKSPEYWAKTIKDIIGATSVRNSRNLDVVKAGYGIDDGNNSLENYYKNIFFEEGGA